MGNYKKHIRNDYSASLIQSWLRHLRKEFSIDVRLFIVLSRCPFCHLCYGYFVNKLD